MVRRLGLSGYQDGPANSAARPSASRAALSPGANPTAATTSATAATGTILALDLGKYKSVACLSDRATATDRFDTVATTACRPWATTGSSATGTA